MSEMGYTGKVRPGGRPDVRELPKLMITKLSVGEMDNNVYLLRCRQTDDQLLVDAADDAAAILGTVGADGLVRVVTTHRHWDHHRALAEVVAATGAETVAGAPDADELPVPVDVRVEDGDRVRVGSCELEVIRLTGHTPGSIALLYDDPDGTPHLFTGDSLFPGGVGKTWSPTTSRRWSRTCRPSCSTGCPTRRGSTPATARTRRWVPSGRTSPQWRERGW